MWAYVAGYKMPFDDPEALGRRVKIAYPVKADQLLGGGVTTLRLQRALGTPGSFKAWESCSSGRTGSGSRSPTARCCTCCSAAPERFPDGAARIYATFDIGLIGYWAVPTAPPWYAAAEGLMEDGRTPGCEG